MRLFENSKFANFELFLDIRKKKLENEQRIYKPNFEKFSFIKVRSSSENLKNSKIFKNIQISHIARMGIIKLSFFHYLWKKAKNA